MKTEHRRTCPSCGSELSGAMEFCPVCMLRKGLGGGVESGESSTADTLKPAPGQAAQRFDHYELATGEDGKTVELGRGAMGVTYKAFDINLRCPVTLKVINERYLGDESARLRFLREARAAASVRHPNVASVFHLGRTGDNYFYAMEFVEGETLENLSRREEVSACLAQDERQGLHARKVMESYQSWFGKGPELAILRMLGLFDRPADEQALGALLKSPSIPGFTEPLTDLRANDHPESDRGVLAGPPSSV
jgi:hypothetical protein